MHTIWSTVFRIHLNGPFFCCCWNFLYTHDEYGANYTYWSFVNECNGYIKWEIFSNKNLGHFLYVVFSFIVEHWAVESVCDKCVDRLHFNKLGKHSEWIVLMCIRCVVGSSDCSFLCVLRYIESNSITIDGLDEISCFKCKTIEQQSDNKKKKCLQWALIDSYLT